jgi:monovalent cation:H+ antiporter-2, CPA2 family
MLAVGAVPEVIYDVSIIFGLAVIVLLVCSKFKIPSVLGFLITGVIAGPDVLHLTQSKDDLSVFAEIGIIFLLFSIGIEFSLKDLIRIRRQVFLGGLMQVVGTTIFAGLLTWLSGIGGREALMLGLLFSFSSTAIVLKVLQDMGRVHSPQGRSTMAILIFQDMAVIPVMLLIPYFAPDSGGLDINFFVTILKALLTVVVVLYLARVLMPKLLFAVAKSKSTELFLMTVLVVCLSVALLTAEMGLSLSLGAFLAGLVISESEYSHEAFSTILPFREVFTSFFFISIGLLVDVDFIFANPINIVIGTFLILGLKMLVGGVAVFLTGNNARVAFLSGLFICQVGEFSFILAGSVIELNLLSNKNYQLFLSISVLSMGLTPYFIEKSDRFSYWLNKVFMSENLKSRFPGLIRSSIKPNIQETKLSDHLVIVGYSEIGKNISKVIKMAKIPFIALDSDPEIVLSAKNKRGTQVLYGNASNVQILKHAGIAQARMVVITISNPAEVHSIVVAIRKLAPKCHVIATSRKTQDFVKLFDAGANEIISEQFEISVEVVTRVLSRYLVARNEIDDFVVRLRQLNYDMERSIRYEQQGLQDYRLEISDTEIITIRIRSTSPFVNQKLANLKMRTNYNISVLAVKRGPDITANPSGDLEVLENDLLVIFGSHESIDAVSRL